MSFLYIKFISKISRTLTIILIKWSINYELQRVKKNKKNPAINSLNADQKITKIMPHWHFQPSVIEKVWLSASNWSPDYSFKQTCNKYKHTYLPFLHMLPRNCPADKTLHVELTMHWMHGMHCQGCRKQVSNTAQTDTSPPTKGQKTSAWKRYFHLFALTNFSSTVLQVMCEAYAKNSSKYLLFSRLPCATEVSE